MRVLVLTNGDYGDYTWCKPKGIYDWIICADNGMKHAKVLGVIPNIIVGDFDSCNQEDLEFFAQQGVEIYKLPCEKDETDTEIALDLAIAKGAVFVDILGGIGSRIDHSLGNIHLLYKAYLKKVKCQLISHQNQVTLVSDQLEVFGKAGDLVSLIPFTEQVQGVKTEGLAYALDGGVFRMGQPYGVSNYMLEERALVSVEEGLLLLMKTRD